MKDDIASTVRSMRLPFLLLTFSVVFLGVSTAVSETGEVSVLQALLALAGALFAHLSVNLLNEFLDYRSGLDETTDRTPFSGGSGALVENPGAAPVVLVAGIAMLALTGMIGTYFAITSGPVIIWIGLLGAAIIVSYTQWINRHAVVCLLAPGLAFGPLMVGGTHYVLTGVLSPGALYLSLVPFFLSNNLLLLNQFPDMAPDSLVGRRHFPIAYGVNRSIAVYAIFSASTLGVLLSALIAGVVSMLALVALLPVIAQLASARRISDALGNPERLIPLMALNVATAIVTPVLLGFSVVWG